jgi:hypothetical protein
LFVVWYLLFVVTYVCMIEIDMENDSSHITHTTSLVESMQMVSVSQTGLLLFFYFFDSTSIWFWVRVGVRFSDVVDFVHHFRSSGKGAIFSFDPVGSYEREVTVMSLLLFSRFSMFSDICSLEHLRFKKKEGRRKVILYLCSMHKHNNKTIVLWEEGGFHRGWVGSWCVLVECLCVGVSGWWNRFVTPATAPWQPNRF